MSKEYIERGAAISVIRKLVTPNKSPAQRELLKAAGIGLQRIRAADVLEVTHGRWETNNDPEEIVKDFSCSVCEEQLCDFDTYALYPGENCYYYCPNCGAKMDGGADNG